MKKISYISLTLLLIVTAACQTNNYLIPIKNLADGPPPYVGIYKGTLPCADCAGIESKLILNEDKTFVYENTYRDTIDKHFTHTGSYTVEENIVNIQQNDTPLHFLRKENDLVFLGSNLLPPQGVLAPYYVLKKQREFIYPGKYETFSEKEDEYQQTITISSQGNSYQVDFAASQAENLEKCHFSTTAQLKKGRLWANISNDENNEILISIAPTHDNLGVEVFDIANHEHLIPFCDGRGSLTGTYMKNTITADSIGVFTASTTIEEVLHTVPLTQIHKKTGQGEFADDVYDDYEVWSRTNDHLFTLTPRYTGNIQQKIERVLIQSPFYKTAKGIHRNSTYQDIDNAYTITEIVPDKKHIILVVDEINAHFSIPKTALLEGWWNITTKTVNRNKIPPAAQTDSFIVWY